MHPPRVGSPTALLGWLPPPVSPSPQCSHRRRRGSSHSATRTEWPRRRPARAATREQKQAVWKTTYFTLLSNDLLSEPSSLEHDKARGGAIHYYLPPGLLSRRVAAGCLPTARRPRTRPALLEQRNPSDRAILTPLFRKTNEGEPYLVIRFTNALPFYFTISTLNLFTPVRSRLALKARGSVIAIGNRPTLHRRDNLPIMVMPPPGSCGMRGAI